MDSFSASIELATISFRNNDSEVNHKNRFDGSLPHYGLFNKTMNYLSSLGFSVGKDQRIEADYKCLSKDHRYGIKGGLEFKAERYPAGFKVQFYQNLNFENKCGGEYDFDKYDKMPYLIKKQFLLTCEKLRSFFIDMRYEDDSKLVAKTAEDKVKLDFVESWHHATMNMEFNLSDYDGLTSTMKPSRYDEAKYYDRDKNLILNGDVKYFRDYSGYLRRGIVYHRLNMMFWIVVNSTETAIRADCELFDLTDCDARCRVARNKTPKEYTEKVCFLGALTDKELERELKRRKKG